MNVGSLFTGIGGIELGFHRQGFQTIWMVEKNQFSRKILSKNFPGVPIWNNIKNFNVMLSRAGFRARTFQMPETGQALKENNLAFGKKCYTPFAWFSQSSQSWKTFQHSLAGAWIEFSGIWPRAGMIRNGIAYRLQPLVRLTDVTEYSSLPTPVATRGGGKREILAERQAWPESERLREDVSDTLSHRCAEMPKRFADKIRATGAKEKLQEKGNTNTSGRRLENRFFSSAQKAELKRFCHYAGKQWQAEPSMGRVAHGVPDRVDRITALGNAVVPQVAEFIAKRIKEVISNEKAL